MTWEAMTSVGSSLALTKEATVVPIWTTWPITLGAAFKILDQLQPTLGWDWNLALDLSVLAV